MIIITTTNCNWVVTRRQ